MAGCCPSARFALYLLLSSALAFAVVQHAFHTREQFYPAVLYLVTSKFSLLVLANAAVAALVLLALFLQQLFLGKLEPREEEVRGAGGGRCARAATRKRREGAPSHTHTSLPPAPRLGPLPRARRASTATCAPPRSRCALR